MSSGTWVFVGGLRVKIISAVPTVIQDAVIAGHDRNELGILVFPNVAGCRALCLDADDDLPLADLIERAEVRAALKSSVEAYNRNNPGNSTRIKHAILMSAPPNIDANEITDKGYINQRAVLECRTDLEEKLYNGDEMVIEIA